MEEIEIKGDMIRLGQLLKLSALADSGADARELLRANGITVNGEPEVRRGRQLHPGDVVAVGAQTIRVVYGAMAYTTAEGRQELLDTVAQAAGELALASACLAEAYEQLDDQSGDRLEQDCFRPVQMAYGRAKRTHTEFAGRHGLQAAAFEEQPAGLPSQGAAAFVKRAIEAADAADRTLAGLQDSMLPVEAGDAELRDGIKAVREPLGDLPGRAREFLRGLGR